MSFVGREDIVGSDEFLPGAFGLRLPGDLNDALECLHVLVAGKTYAMRNWADGKPSATIVGSPVEEEGYLTLGSASGSLRTGIRDSFPQMTMLVVSRDTSPTPGALTSSRFLHMGSFNGSGANTGLSIYTGHDGTTADTRCSARYIDGGAVTATATVIQAGLGWGCRIATIGDPTDELILANRTSDVTSSYDIQAGFARQNNGLPILIGAANNSSYGGSGDVALAATWSRILTPTERTVIYDWAKRLCASVGLSV